jgi:hypothetical protein
MRFLCYEDILVEGHSGKRTLLNRYEHPLGEERIVFMASDHQWKAGSFP